MAESFELPDETERLQINLEDDVRSFLLSRLTGNQMDPKKRAQLQGLGVDVRRLSKPSYISIKSGCDLPEEGPVDGCHVGAEGYMVHEDEAVVHLAFKCGDADHDMHYTTFMPMSIIELAKAMEAVWPGAIMGPLMDQAVDLGRATRRSTMNAADIDEEGAQRLMDAIKRMDEEGPGFDFDDSEEDLDALDSEDLEISESEDEPDGLSSDDDLCF